MYTLQASSFQLYMYMYVRTAATNDLGQKNYFVEAAELNEDPQTSDVRANDFQLTHNI